MKACIFNKFGHADVMHVEKNISVPDPKDNEVQIRVHYAGVNPVDWKIREGYLSDKIPHEFPIVPGLDASGVVVATGKNAKKFKVGDEVFGFSRPSLVKWGTYAEYTCFPESVLVKRPKSLSFQLLASLPIAALTAWQALFDEGKIMGGESILVQGGAGGVGSMVLQFASWKGCKVATTAHTENHEYVRSLGASLAIDYEKENVAKVLRENFPKGIDVVIDCVGGATFKDSFKLVKKGGRVISIVEWDAKDHSTKEISSSFVFVSPNSDELAQIVALIEKGKIKSPKITEFSLDDAKKAQLLSEQGHVRGKIVLKVA